MVWFKFSQQLIKALGVIEVHCVAEFMEENVAHQLRAQEEEIIIEIDVALTGTASPSTFLAPDAGLAIKQPGLLADFLQPGQKISLPLYLEPPPEQFLAALGIRTIPGQH